MIVRSNLFLGLSLLLLAGYLYSLPVHAAKKSKPIYIESDSLHVEQKKGTRHFNGHVKFIQGDLIIHADSILTKDKNGNLDTVVDESSMSEAARLSRAFNHMTQHIRQLVDDVRAKGYCEVYCVAQDCVNDPDESCLILFDRYADITGEVPPCEPPVEEGD